MAFYDSTLIAANKALGGGIGALRAAKSYSMPLANSAKRIARSVASAPHMQRNLIIGGLAGVGGGVGYDSFDRRSDWRSKTGAGIKGAVIGAMLGAGYAGYKGIPAGAGTGIKGMAKGMMGDASSRMRSAYGRAAGNWRGAVAGAQMRSTPGYNYTQKLLTAGNPFHMGA